MGFIDEDYCRERNYSFTLEPCLTVAGQAHQAM